MNFRIACAALLPTAPMALLAAAIVNAHRFGGRVRQIHFGDSRVIGEGILVKIRGKVAPPPSRDSAPSCPCRGLILRPPTLYEPAFQPASSCVLRSGVRSCPCCKMGELRIIGDSLARLTGYVVPGPLVTDRRKSRSCCPGKGLNRHGQRRQILASGEGPAR